MDEINYIFDGITFTRTNIKNFPVAGAPFNNPRIMPHNLPAEQNLLGAILLDNSVIERIDDRLVATHFYDPLHGRIFTTMQRLIERGQLANPVTLKSFFANSTGLDDGDVVNAIVRSRTPLLAGRWCCDAFAHCYGYC